MKVQKKKQNGITLIALVISIIVILILAGISLNVVVGDNGILTQALRAKELTELSSEEEVLSSYVFSAKMGRTKIGNKLENPTLSNGTTWNLWVGNVDGVQKTFGDGWYFIDSNTNIDGDTITKNKWLVNYETGEDVKIDETFSNLYYGASLAVTDGLVFNVDPTNLRNINNLGEGVTAHGFDDENETGGIIDGILRFDGINDYITIDGTLDVTDEITIEFYGKANGYSGDYNLISFFSTYGSNYSDSGTGNGYMRIWSYSHVNPRICCNFGRANCGNSEIWENSQAKHNLAVRSNVTLNNDFMVTITYNHSTQIFSLYIDGIVKQSAKLDINYWETFKNNISTKVECFQIGKVTWNSIIGYLNGDVYSVRIYNKALTAEQVEKNYTATKKYRELNNSN